MIARKIGAVPIALAGVLLLAGSTPASAEPEHGTIDARVMRLLTQFPLIDGHNDLPWEIRKRDGGDVDQLDLMKSHWAPPPSLSSPDQPPPLMTDIPRLLAGHVGAQFWSVWIPPALSGPAATRMVIEQIDSVKTMVRRYSATFSLAYSTADIERAKSDGKIASLIGMEGGAPIDNSLALLRQLYDLGVRYMTLTHTLTTDWADSATDTLRHGGLSPFGKSVVLEMNRIGMMVDLSHVSPGAMAAVLDITRAPVIFSHSGSRAIAEHPRNVPDDILRRLRDNHGIVMVNFAPEYATNARVHWEADRAAQKTRLTGSDTGVYVGQPDRAASALAQWDAAHPAPPVTIADIADHIDHIVAVAGIDAVGLGSDFDGLTRTPTGLDGVDRFPALFAELMRRGWSEQALTKFARGNIVRVLQEVEATAAKLEEPTTHASVP